MVYSACNHPTPLLCVLLLLFGFNVDGLELVACLPENLLPGCHTAASVVGSNAYHMVTSPRILLPSGMYESLAGIVRAAA